MDSFWTHGNVASVQTGNANQNARIQSIERRGWGTVIHVETPSQGTFHRLWYDPYDFYVHLPLTNGVLLGDRRPTVRRVFVMWTANSRGVDIERVDVWDGANLKATIRPTHDQVHSFDNDLSHWNRNLHPNVNQWEVNPQFPVQFGVGISIHFHVNHVEQGVDFTISAAGVDLE